MIKYPFLAPNIKIQITFDLSLARGLDYYTGVIYEAVITEGKLQVGSIAAGGRYDELVGMFSGERVPGSVLSKDLSVAVGFSVGVERIFAIMEDRAKANKDGHRTTQTQVLVCSIDDNLIKERMKICRELWDAGIKAETLPKQNPRLPAQFKYAEDNKIPFAVLIGGKEVETQVIQFKDLVNRKQDTIQRAEMIAEIKKRI